MGQYSPIPDSTLTIHFEDGQVSGNGGCNSYGGEYRVSGDKLKLEKLMSTLMACADPAMMEQETIFMQALGDAQRFDIADGRLQVYGSDGEALTFVPIE
jgi:heat shock protein HslJ